MNGKKTITMLGYLLLAVLAIAAVISLMNEQTGLAIFFGTFFVILVVVLGIYMKEEPDEFSAFVKERKRILRVYDSVIVEVEDIPNIAGKNIIKVKTIDDLVDAQLELREPIYYKNDNDSCFFLLLHYNEACIFILKMNDSVVSPTEQSIKFMKEDPEDKKQDTNILENVENTLVYKLDEMRSFKISPIRQQETLEVVDDTAIVEDIKNNDNHITKESLESEISKTMYIKDLKKKIKSLEEEEKQVTRAKKKEEKIKTRELEQKEAKKKASTSKPKKKAPVKKDSHSNKRAASYAKKKK